MQHQWRVTAAAVCVISLVLLLLQFGASPFSREQIGGSEPVNCPPQDRRIVAAATPEEIFCRWNFLRYEPSEWEKDWKANIETYRHDVCRRLAQETAKTIPFMRASLTWSKYLKADANGEKALATEENLAFFSRLIYKRECEPGVEDFTAEYIEPLFGLLRDPFSICGNVPDTVPRELIQRSEGERIQSKFWMLNAVHAPFKRWTSRETKPKAFTTEGFGTDRMKVGAKRILLDLGSSYFSSWGSDTAAYSTGFFYHMFKERGVPFDRIFSFEYEKLDPHFAWDNTPPEAMSVYTFINHGVESNKSSQFNPWNLLRQVATEADWVIIKLDIDTPNIERGLMNQLLDDPTLSGLVDEMYFEHHVFVNEMVPYWGIREGSPETIALSYDWFTRLRQRGVRMHSWP